MLAFLVLLLQLKFQLSFEREVETLNSPIERAALLQLRSSLGLRSKEWPKKVNPCINWIGVSCTNGSVSAINISGFRRTRLGSQNPKFVVDALVNLTHLTSFNASRFQLPGSIPNWFGQSLGSLRVLDLSFCGIQNVIPASLGNLTNLTSLYLSGNNLAGSIPLSLGQLALLSVLNLSQNQLNGSIPLSFGSLGNLTSLDISSNFLSGSIPPDIGTLLKLQYLNLSNNRLSSSIPAQLGDLGQLVDLDLSFNSLSGSLLVDLRGLKNLKRLLLKSNMFLGSLPINLFPTLSQLDIVVLSNNDFTGPVPNVLWILPRLRLLDISRNNFTGFLPNSTFNVNISTARLNISGNLFYGALKPILRRFNIIDLSKNYFEGKVLDFMPDNASLASNCLQNMLNQRSFSECASFYHERGLIFDNFGRSNSTQSPTQEFDGKNNKKLIILASVLGSAGLIMLLTILVFLLICIWKRGLTNQRGNDVGPVPIGTSPPPSDVAIKISSFGEVFTYQQLLKATGDFSNVNLIKHGHSGDFYKGVLENGMTIVIKRLDIQTIKNGSGIVELELFSKVSHPRLVPLLGHCSENEDEMFLIYKYMPNGDLSSSLFRKINSNDDSLQSLDWITRSKIATGAAEGLSYLHHECKPPIMHRDVQASSILLDDKYEVRLGSLSEVCPQGDTHQSRITKLLRLPQSSEQSTSGSTMATCAYDVYCFGKVLLELVTGKLGMSACNETQFKEWLEQILPYINNNDKELVTKIVDPFLIIDEDLLEEVWSMAIIAKSCLNPKPSRRPLMRYIVKALENPLKVVREESSAKLKSTSSKGSWNATLFGSWRTLSDVAGIPGGPSTRLEGASSLKHSGTSNSSESGQNGGGEHSSSRRQISKEICPEPSEGQDIEKQVQE